MSRDGRGNPGRIVLKNQPRLTLAAVLRRRKSTLKKLADELGVTTYTALANWCDRMGIAQPEQREFDLAFPPTMKVNSPQEGVIVLEPPPVVDEHTGRAIDPAAPVEPGVQVVTEPTDPTQKKRRSKKESQPDEG